MSLPGLGLDDPNDDDVQGQDQTTQHELRKEEEWRFEVVIGRSVNVKITAGTAELFGTELVLGHPYTFVSTKAAIFTWTGCTIEVTVDNDKNGSNSGLGPALLSEYIAEETCMNEYTNTHFALEEIRTAAGSSSNAGTGPRVLILGPSHSGKSTLAKTLTSYAVRSARSPVVVNLDPAEGVLSLPGTLTASVFKTLVEVEDVNGWGTAPMSGPNGEIPVKLPLVYYYGSMDPEEKVGGGHGAVFKKQVARLALAVQGRMTTPQQEDVRASGVIIDTAGAIISSKGSAAGYDLVAHIIGELAVNVIICLGSERLYSDMVKRFDGQPASGLVTGAGKNNTGAGAGGTAGTISVVKLPKSGGTVDRDINFMRALRDVQVRTYFYGNPRVGAGITLQPRQQQIDFDSVTVWRRISPGSRTSYNSTAVGGGADDDDEDTFLPGGADDSTGGANVGLSTSGNGTGSGTGGGSRGSGVPLPADQIFERLSSPVPALKNCVLAVMNCAPEPDANSNTEQTVLATSSVMGFLYITDIDESRRKISVLSPMAGRPPNRALVWAEGIDGSLGVAS